MDTMGMWKHYQELANIKLDFTDVLPAEGYDEKKSLMWASNEYPDIFVRAQLRYQYQFGTWLEVKDGKVSTYLTDDGFKDELKWLS